MKRIALLVVSLSVVPGVVDACPVCFGAVHSPLLDSARLGVLAMVGVTLIVLAAFGAWFLRLRRLATAAEVAEEQP